MTPLNEQTIKRLQKLAGINEIKIQNPFANLERLIKSYIDEFDYHNPTYYIINNVLTSWIEQFSGDNDAMGEYTTEIDLQDIRGLIESGEASQELIDWVKEIDRLPPNQMYIYNKDAHTSIKYTTDSNGTLIVSTPSGINPDNGNLLSRYDSTGKLIPIN